MYGFGLQQRTGLPTKFEQFRQNIELTANQKQSIRDSHNYLRRQMQQFDYVSNSFLTGSYIKNTMIRPPNDVDIFVLINHSYSEITPNAVLSKLKRHLSTSYPNSTIRQDKPCIVLDLSHCKFELTPAIPVYQHNDSDYYIPLQGANDWLYVENPMVLGRQLSDANQRLDGRLVPLIKMMKACKRHNNITDKKSFEMEEIAITYLVHIDGYRDGVQQLLRAYNWTDRRRSHDEIEIMTDQEFASYCNTTLFGSDFPT